jgi:hypothetical protein
VPGLLGYTTVRWPTWGSFSRKAVRLCYGTERDRLMNTVGGASEDERPRRRGAPAMADVAVVAGVSRMAVSRTQRPRECQAGTRDRVCEPP